MLTAGLLIALGLVLLFVGGEALVRGAVILAHRWRLPPVLIGLTVVGFGTSMPELVVSLRAALGGTPDIALGNIVGSNIANALLIIGVAALVWPIDTRGLHLRRDLAVMLAAAAVLILPFAMETVGRGMGLALLVGLAVYLVLAFRTAQVTPDTGEPAPSSPGGLPGALGMVALGLVALVLGARWLVDGAVTVARDFGVSEAFIGLTIVAVGTSLPELATSVIAALRRQSAIAVGNVVGSNIFNVMGILGVTAVVAPVPVAPRFLVLDLPAMLAASVVLALMLRASRLGRAAGAGLLVAYGAYVWFAAG